MNRFSMLLLGCISALAQDQSATQTPTWSATYSADLKSQYFGSVVDAVFAKQPVVQQELDINRTMSDGKTILTLTIWNSTGFSDWFKNFAYETDTDFFISRRFKGWTVTTGGEIFFLNPAAGFDVVVFDTKVSRGFKWGDDTLIPYFETAVYGLTNKEPKHGGTYPMIGTLYRHKLNPRLAIAAQFHETYDVNGGFAFHPRTSIFYGDVGLGIALTESVTLTVPRIGYGGAWDDPQRPKKVTWSMGFAKRW